MEPDSTVRSQNSSDSKDSKDSKVESRPDSKQSAENLISENTRQTTRVKDDSNLLMLTSCGQLLLGVVLVVFGVMVLVHGASLGGSGAGLWAGAGALVAGALGVVATLATSPAEKTAPGSQQTSGFSTAHLASSLVALALSNMAAITALTAVVRDSQNNAELTALNTSDQDGSSIGLERGWPGFLASIGLLVASVAELLISGYSCVILAPRLCGCLRSTGQDQSGGSQLKTHNMVHQWVTAQTGLPQTKAQQVYLVQPIMPVHPLLHTPYRIAAAPGKYPGGLIPAGSLPRQPPPSYRPAGSVISGYKVTTGHGPHPLLPPNLPYHPHMIRVKRKRYTQPEHEEMRDRRRKETKTDANKKMTPVSGEDQVDLANTYTGLDKRISEEFISIAMDPERKSRASSSIGSDIGSGVGKTSKENAQSKL